MQFSNAIMIAIENVSRIDRSLIEYGAASTFRRKMCGVMRVGGQENQVRVREEKTFLQECDL